MLAVWRSNSFPCINSKMGTEPTTSPTMSPDEMEDRTTRRLARQSRVIPIAHCRARVRVALAEWCLLQPIVRMHVSGYHGRSTHSIAQRGCVTRGRGYPLVCGSRLLGAPYHSRIGLLLIHHSPPPTPFTQSPALFVCRSDAQATSSPQSVRL
jgi:hypothetical protein